MVTPSESLPSSSTTAENLRRGSSLNVLFSKSGEEAECGGGELRRAGSLRLSRGDSGDATRHHRDDRRPEETEVEDGNGNSSGNRGIGKRDPENRNLLDVPDDKGGSTRQQRKDTIAAAVGRLVSESSSPARPARPNRHSAPAAAAAAAAAEAAAAAAAAAPAPEHLARSLLQLGCPVVSMPKPRGGVGSEQNAQASSDSDDSTTSHRGPHRHLANSQQQHHHAQPQGQIQGHSLAHQNTVHGYGLLPKVQVSSPPNTPESYHNGSAGSIGARSAPSTPLQGVVGGSSQQQQNQQQQASQPVGGLQLTVASVSPPPPRSPSHAALRCQDSQLSKPLSRSTPSMTAGTVNRSSTRSSPASTSSARQKKFHRHFSQVTADERVLNYYSCALVGDILLQGHLYITPNYFAFYSNVFGYVTKLLIPTASVLKISKEKTARIIPNAVAVATLDGRHVFCSLLSRDSTFKLMKQVWDAALEARDPVTDLLPLPVEAKLLASPHSSSLVDDSEVNAEGDEEDEEEEEEDEEEEDSSMSESGTDLISRAPTVCTDTTDALTTATTTTTAAAAAAAAAAATSIPRLSLTAARLEQIALPKRLPAERKAQIGSFGSFIRCGMRPATIIAILVGLLAALYVSAALMMLRIDRLHTAYVNNPLASPERFTQDRLMQYLASNLDQIVKVRQSLQTLSQQLVTMNPESGTESALSGRAIEPEESPS